MSYDLHLKPEAKGALHQKQNQMMMMMPKMQQAIRLLQAPVMELASMIQEELEKNPVLEEGIEESSDQEEDLLHEEPEEVSTEEKEIDFDDNDFEIMKRLDEDFRDHFAESGNYNNVRTAEEEKKKTYLETSIQETKSLFSSLMDQAHDTFESEEELKVAEVIIGNLDERGFLQIPLEELVLLTGADKQVIQEVLTEVQALDPPGIAAKDIQECLLIQLRLQGKEETLAYRLIRDCYDDLVHNRIPVIRAKLKTSLEEIEAAIQQDVASLGLRPGSEDSQKAAAHITPDATIVEEGGVLTVWINDEQVPTLRINRKYLAMLEDQSLKKEEKQYIQKNVLSAKWMVRNIYQRNDTLFRIATYIAKKQEQFFLDPQGKLVPMIMKEVAEEIEVHESTVARAVSDKYVETPRGLLSFRFFFTTGYQTEEGEELSAHSVKNAILEIVNHEDKQHPLSDEKISKLLKERGIPCARRTIAKYRTALEIGTAHQRRKYSSQATS